MYHLITQKDIDDITTRLETRGESGAKVTYNRILAQLSKQRDIIKEARQTVQAQEKELTILLIAADKLGFKL